MAPAHQISGMGCPVVVAGFSEGRERRLDCHCLQTVAGELGANPQRTIARCRAGPRQAAGEATVVLPAGFGHAFDGCRGFRFGDAACLKFAGEFPSGMLATYQQA